MSGEDAAANGRLAKTLTGTGDFTTLAPILRGALRDNPTRATVELADLSRQTHALDSGSGAKLDRILDSEAKALGLPSPITQKPAPRQAASLAPTTLNDAGGSAAPTPEIPASKTAQTRKPPPQILAAAARPGPSQSFPRPKTKPAPPSLPAIHPDFLNKLSELESKSSGGYAAKTGKLPPKGTMRGSLALGKYQFQRGALIESGYVDEKTHRWTGKDGVNSAEDFLKRPKVQEKANREFFDSYWNVRLKRNGARAREGQIIDGIRDRFTVTKSGLLAAAHREGPKRVKEYLNRLESLGWKSSKRKFGDAKQTEKFLAIETRLRKFSTVPFNK